MANHFRQPDNSLANRFRERALYGTNHETLLAANEVNGSHNYGSVHINNSSAIVGNNYNVNVTYHSDEHHVTRFLDSLHHRMMNSRFNEIKSATENTFEWVFDVTNPEPSAMRLRSWLRYGESMFLIQGKPGSGKSTFMKYLFQHMQMDRMSEGSAARQSMLPVFHGFWRAGVPLQHNFKGMLASLAFHILQAQSCLHSKLELFLRNSDRRCIEDWNVLDLKRLLLLLSKASTFKICFFIDGLDEFDDQAEFEALMASLDLVRHAGHKFCLSTRPNDHILWCFHGVPGLRLQDLTANDIRTHVRETLFCKTKFRKDIPARDQLVHELTTVMCEKAEGVFLWVYYVLRNVCIGIRNAEDLRDLLRRVSLLPSALVDLYVHMWELRNDDNQIHREESAKLFALARYLPMSALQYAIAMDPDLCEQYAQTGCCVHNKDLIHACLRFLKRLNCRSAGLLEVKANSVILDPQEYDGCEQAKIDSLFSDVSALQVSFIHLSVYEFLFEHAEGKRVRGSAWSSQQIGGIVALAYVACQLRSHSELFPFYTDLLSLLKRIACHTLELDPFHILVPICLSCTEQSVRSSSLYPNDWVHCFYLAHRHEWYDGASSSDIIPFEGRLAIDTQTLITATRPDSKAVSKYFARNEPHWTSYYKCHLLTEAYRVHVQRRACFQSLIMESAALTIPQTSTDLNFMFTARSPIVQLLAEELSIVFAPFYEHADTSNLQSLISCLSHHYNYFAHQVLSLPVSVSNPRTVDLIFDSYSVSQVCPDNRGCDKLVIDLFVQLPVHAVIDTFVASAVDVVNDNGAFDARSMYVSTKTGSDHYRFIRANFGRLPHSFFWIKRSDRRRCNPEFSFPNPEDSETLWHAIQNQILIDIPSLTGYDSRATYLSRAQFMAKFYPPGIEPDVYFMDAETDTPAVQLDPTQEVTESNWKEHCTMRNYFTKLAEKEKREITSPATSGTASSSLSPEATEPSQKSTPARSSKKRPWEI